MRKTIFLGTALLFFIGCKSENERRIVGKWQALQLMECDNIVPIQTELVDIEFMSNGKYIFHSTLNVKEEGIYKIRKNFLFTQDKMREKAPEKAVLIQSIEDDTLVLQMSYKGKDQWLTLVKEGVSEKAKDDKDAQAVADVSETPTTVASTNLAINPLDSIQKAEEQKKQEAANKEAERKKEEAAADKKREAEADRKREAAKKESSSSSASEAYKKREAKRIAEERKAKEAAEKKAAIFRKEYAIREAERKKREARKN